LKLNIISLISTIIDLNHYYLLAFIVLFYDLPSHQD